MYRNDRDALAQEVDALRQEQQQLQTENAAMRRALLARRAQPPVPPAANVYRLDPATLSDGERAALASHDVQPFPVWAALFLHFMTFGVFSLVHFSLLHERLPRADHRDPSVAKAIGFSFIPYFNLYWVVFNTLRIVDRINFQHRLRGRPDAVPRSLAIACVVIGVIPYINVALGLTIFWPLLIYYLQRATNELAERKGVRVALDADWGRARIDTPSVRVGNLPGPEDALVEQAQIEAEAAAEATADVRRAG